MKDKTRISVGVRVCEQLRSCGRPGDFTKSGGAKLESIEFAYPPSVLVYDQLAHYGTADFSLGGNSLDFDYAASLDVAFRPEDIVLQFAPVYPVGTYEPVIYRFSIDEWLVGPGWIR
jgi:hypothetical protein